MVVINNYHDNYFKGYTDQPVCHVDCINCCPWTGKDAGTWPVNLLYYYS